MEQGEALDLLRKAVLACMDAKIKIGVRPVDWARQIEIIAEGVGLQDGRFVMREAVEDNINRDEPLLHSKTSTSQSDQGCFARDTGNKDHGDDQKKCGVDG